MTATTVDLRGLKCPSPLVRLNDTITRIAAGAEFVAVADDRAFEPDVRAWCELTGHELVALEVAGADIHARIRKQG
ncbi:MAG: sulfurtransferase TusA family protein [Gammaproteobacteria bacterium]